MSERDIRKAQEEVEESHGQNMRKIQGRNRKMARQRWEEGTPYSVIAGWTGLSATQVADVCKKYRNDY